MERTWVNGIKVPCKSKPNSKVTDDLLVPLSFQDCWADPWPELDPGPVVLWPTHFKKKSPGHRKNVLFISFHGLGLCFLASSTKNRWVTFIIGSLSSSHVSYQTSWNFRETTIFYKPKWCADLESNSEILVLCHFWIFQKQVCASPGGFWSINGEEPQIVAGSIMRSHECILQGEWSNRLQVYRWKQRWCWVGLTACSFLAHAGLADMQTPRKHLWTCFSSSTY